MFNPTTSPPQFVIDAIPGAQPLSDAVVEKRAAAREAGIRMRETTAAARAVCSGPISERNPARGVTTAQMTKALDAHSAAVDAADAAQTAHRRALAALHAHVNEGMRSAEFIDAQEDLADRAQERAVEAFAALREALTDRDKFERAIGRRRESARGGDDVSYLLSGVERHVEARILDERNRAIVELEGSTMLPADRIAFAKRRGLIK